MRACESNEKEIKLMWPYCNTLKEHIYLLYIYASL